MKKLLNNCSCICFFILISYTSILKAEGFYIDPQSAEGMGIAQAGAAVGYSDGSTGFYNPGALIIHDQSQVSLQLHGFNPSAKFSDSGSSVGSANNIGTNEADGGRDALVPMLYAVSPISNKITGSIYLNSPFGLGTEYPKDWLGRYQAVESSMQMVNLGSAFSYNLGSGLSIGAGLSAIYAKTKISSALDFGTVAENALGAESAKALGLEAQRDDGLITVKANDWAMGWNAGLLYRYGDQQKNRLGLSYRGKTDLKFHNGSAKFFVPQSASPLALGGLFSDTTARSTITLPESVTFGTKTYLSEKLAFLQQNTWTRWSRIKDFNVSFDNPLQPGLSTPQDWENSWFHSVGLAHNTTENIEIRCGVGYESGIIPNASRRYPRLPTSESIWTSLGVGIKFPEKNIHVDLSFTRVDYNSGREDSIGPTGDRLNGSWDVATNAVSTAVTFHW